MLVLNLGCEQGHRFEGWFGSADDFESQQTRGLVGCPVCASTQVQRLPSAPRLNVSRPREPELPPSATEQPQTALQLVRQMLARTEDVGERFPEEARRIHYGEAKERAIRGRASREDTLALVEEGIELIALPEPLKGTLQ
jgi:hypothetical protein